MMDTLPRYVDMYCVIGSEVNRTNVNVLSFDNLIELGKRVAIVYDLQSKYRYVSFEVLCEHITLFIKTPFGRRMLLDLFEKDKL
jgi:hypothetical protein